MTKAVEETFRQTMSAQWGETVGVRLEAQRGIGPGFDTLRLFAATLVLLSHAFSLTDSAEPVSRLSNGQTAAGPLGVAVFFVISGFLISASFDRSHGISEFVVRRALRIMPGLICVVLLTACLFGPLLSSLGVECYFRHPEFHRYFLNILFKSENTLPGVFSANPHPEVNGSLWTLKYEVLCYCTIAMLLSLKLTESLNIRILVALAVIGAVAQQLHALDRIEHIESGLYRVLLTNVGNMIVQFAYFAVGAAIHLGRHRLPLNIGLAAALVAITLVGSTLGILNLLLPFAVGYLVIVFGLMKLRFAAKVTRGDYSYGLYVWAFPVQQTIIQLVPDYVFWWANIALALPVTLMLAAASWHCIERPALTLIRRSRSSCPRSPRASTSFSRQSSKQDVDGRDKPGHDSR
jgi:peptidoglycan/LPS O-acetylase OafA/YrhL